MLIFEVAENPNFSLLWEKMFAESKYQIEREESGNIYRILTDDGETGRLSFLGNAVSIDFGDDTSDVLFIRYVSIFSEKGVVFENPDDEVQILMIPNPRPTPMEVLESFAIHTDLDEESFLNSYNEILNNESFDDPEQPAAERVSERFVKFLMDNPGLRDPQAILSHSTEIYINSSNIFPLQKSSYKSFELLDKVIIQDEGFAGFLSADFDLLFSRMESYEDGSYGFFGQINLYGVPSNDVRDEEFIEQERLRLLEVAKDIVNEADFHVAIDDMNQSLDSMLEYDHPGEWMSSFRWKNGDVEEEREFFPREYDN